MEKHEEQQNPGEEHEEEVKIPKACGVLAQNGDNDSDGEESPKEETKYKSSEMSIRYEERDTVTGTLELTTKKVLWTNEGSDNTICFSYLDFVIHAISRCQPESILTQLKLEMYPNLYSRIYGKEEEKEESDEDYEELDPEEKWIVLFFIPHVQSEIETIFEAFSEWSRLNPDPDSDTQEEEELYTNENFYDINNIDQLNIQDAETFVDAEEDQPKKQTNNDSESAKDEK